MFADKIEFRRLTDGGEGAILGDEGSVVCFAGREVVGGERVA